MSEKTKVPTLAEWLRSAEQEWRLKCLAASLLEMSDREFADWLGKFQPAEARLALKEYRSAKQRPNKQQACLELLRRRAEGATIEELQALTDWQAHSVRGFLAGTGKRNLGLALFSDKAAGQPRRYSSSVTL
jgi:hypothetical protein